MERFGFVGLPNAGKSSLYNSLAGGGALAAPYAFATTDPNVGVAKVPDHRLGKLADMSKSRNIVPASVQFVDIGGLVEGASTGEGLGNRFLAHIREVDAVVYLLRGFVDRIDVAPTGEVRVVDYKTARAPREGFEATALFQMRFYALVLWRLYQRVPRLLQLVYLGSGEVLRYSPDESDLLATERKVKALWTAISRAHESGDWRPRRSARSSSRLRQSLPPRRRRIARRTSS